MALSLERPGKPARFASTVRDVLRQAPTVSQPGLLPALPAVLSLIRVQLSGRLVSERMSPRMTVQYTAAGHGGDRLDYAKFETKNKRGSFTVRVWLRSHSSLL